MTAVRKTRAAASVATLTLDVAKFTLSRMQQIAEVLAKSGFHKAVANLGWLFAERGFRFLVGAIVGFLVARYLGPARLGTLSYCVALITLIGFLPALGLDAVLKREILQQPQKTSELLASGFLLRLIAGFAVYVGIGAFLLWGWGLSEEERRLVAIFGLLVFQPALLIPDLWLQAHLRAKAVATIQAVILSMSSVARVWLIFKEGSLAAFALVVVIEMLLGAAGVFWFAYRNGLRFPRAAASFTVMRRLLGEAWPLMFASLAIIVYMKIDEVMLRHMAGASAVGIYSAATRLSEAWYFIPVALASSMLSALLRARESGESTYGMRLQQYYDFSALAAYALSIPIALAAPWIVRVAYGEAYSEAGPILAVHIWSSIFVFVGVARGQWLVNEGLQGFYLAATVGGAVVNVLANLLFIPRWGGLGAAYATVGAYAFASWIASYFHPRVRETAAMQTRAVLIPLRGWRYFGK